MRVVRTLNIFIYRNWHKLRAIFGGGEFGCVLSILNGGWKGNIVEVGIGEGHVLGLYNIEKRRLA